jgi:hypothetical protein
VCVGVWVYILVVERCIDLTLLSLFPLLLPQVHPAVWGGRPEDHHGKGEVRKSYYYGLYLSFFLLSPEVRKLSRGLRRSLSRGGLSGG